MPPDYLYPQDSANKPKTMFDSIFGSILGTDSNGNPKTFDLGKYIKLPDLTVKADNKQSSVLVVAAVAAVAAFVYYKKKKK